MLRTELRSFQAVATAGGYTAASKVLNVGQPTLTTQIKALEARYEIELFQRKGRRVALTHAGQELFKLTSKIAMHEREVEVLLQSYKGLTTGQLRVAAVSPFHVVDIVTVFREKYPKIEIFINLGNSHETMQRLLDSEADVGIFAWEDEAPHVTLDPYRSHNVAIFVNEDHKFFHRDSISIREIEGEKLILREHGSTTRSAFELAAAKAGVTVNPILEISSREGIWQSVKRGLGIGVVADSEFVSHPDLKWIPFHDVDINTHYFLSYLTDRQDSRLIQAFREAAAVTKAEQG
ncbi:MAG: LysR substrate-binding domain-containing protein [Planctomycetota bacterium]